MVVSKILNFSSYNPYFESKNQKSQMKNFLLLIIFVESIAVTFSKTKKCAFSFSINPRIG
jgi:predicted permease